MLANDEKVIALERRVQSLESLLLSSQRQVSFSEVRETNERILLQQVDILANKLGLADQPQFFVGATPLRVVELTEIFESSSQATKLFENPARVREDGFGMYSADRRSMIVQGQARELQLSTQIRRIGRDGRFIALFRGDDDFLGWAMKGTGWPLRPDQLASPNRVNSLVLIEATYGAVVLANHLLQLANPLTTPIQFSIGLRNMKWNGQGPMLLNGKADRQMHFAPQVQADVDSCLFSVLAPEDQSPERTTFMLASEIYRRFGLPDDRVPYTEIEEGERRVVPAQF
jgi:hypothetical protein